MPPLLSVSVLSSVIKDALVSFSLLKRERFFDVPYLIFQSRSLFSCYILCHHMFYFVYVTGRETTTDIWPNSRQETTGKRPQRTL